MKNCQTCFFKCSPGKYGRGRWLRMVGRRPKVMPPPSSVVCKGTTFLFSSSSSSFAHLHTGSIFLLFWAGGPFLWAVSFSFLSLSLSPSPHLQVHLPLCVAFALRSREGKKALPIIPHDFFFFVAKKVLNPPSISPHKRARRNDL